MGSIFSRLNSNISSGNGTNTSTILSNSSRNCTVKAAGVLEEVASRAANNVYFPH